MKKIKTYVRAIILDSRGLETLEYAIIAGLIVAASLTVIGLIGTYAKTTFTTVQELIGA